MTLKGRVLRLHPIQPDGRLAIRPSFPGCGPRTKLVHALVAEAFYGSRPTGQHVRHLNGDKLDNSAENLCYGTESENRRDSVKHGTHVQARKTHCPRGHKYFDKNLVPSMLPRERKCLACHRARKQHDRHPELDFVELSHRNYEEILVA